MRSQQAAPTLCTDEPGVQARYAQQFYRDLEEVFPLVDEGVEPRLHGLIELKGGCFLGDVCKAPDFGASVCALTRATGLSLAESVLRYAVATGADASTLVGESTTFFSYSWTGTRFTFLSS